MSDTTTAHELVHVAYGLSTAGISLAMHAGVIHDGGSLPPQALREVAEALHVIATQLETISSRLEGP